MSFTIKLPAKTLKNGKTFPAIEKTFDSGAKLDQWWQKENWKRREPSKRKRKRKKTEQ